MAQACNTGLQPLVRAAVPTLKRDRLSWVDQNYLREDTLCAANALLVSAQARLTQARLTLANPWGGGEVASADGMRFAVPVRTVHAGPNPKYFGVGRGVTWYNLLSDPFSGLNDITVPGTLRDSLIVEKADVARRSPLLHEHINMLGRYSFSVPESVAKGELRPWRDPADGLA